MSTDVNGSRDTRAGLRGTDRPMNALRIVVASLVSLGLAACSSSSSTSSSASASSTAAKPSGGNSSVASNSGKPVAKDTGTPAPAGNPDYKGPPIGEDKEFFGLTLPPMGKWKPTYDADIKVAKWENDDVMTGIVLRIVKEKLDNIEDLKKEAPMMMQLGSAITKVEEEKKTDKGWYAVVVQDKDPTLIYVRKFNVTVVCSANIGKSDLGDSIKKEDALKACESFEPKK